MSGLCASKLEWSEVTVVPSNTERMEHDPAGKPINQDYAITKL